jgi:hypothetical protein
MIQQHVLSKDMVLLTTNHIVILMQICKLSIGFFENFYLPVPLIDPKDFSRSEAGNLLDFK